MEDKAQTAWGKIKSEIPIISLIAGLAGLLYGLNAYVDTRIKSVVENENYIHKIASEVRPSVIFDGKGTILVDQGAMRFLDSIVPFGKEVRSNVPAHFLVHPKQFLAFAPLMSTFDSSVAGSSVERTNQIDWVYTMYGGGYWAADSPTDIVPIPKFRLEILQ